MGVLLGIADKYSITELLLRGRRLSALYPGHGKSELKPRGDTKLDKDVANMNINEGAINTIPLLKSISIEETCFSLREKTRNKH